MWNIENLNRAMHNNYSLLIIRDMINLFNFSTGGFVLGLLHYIQHLESAQRRQS